LLKMSYSEVRLSDLPRYRLYSEEGKCGAARTVHGNYEKTEPTPIKKVVRTEVIVFTVDLKIESIFPKEKYEVLFVLCRSKKML